jgi:hypothetical protein
VSAFLAQGATKAAIRECPSVVPLREFGEHLLDPALTRSGAENARDHPTKDAATCVLAPEHRRIRSERACVESASPGSYAGWPSARTSLCYFPREVFFGLGFVVAPVPVAVACRFCFFVAI